MTFEGLLLFILAVQIIHFAGTWKLYQKAGRQAWEAAIPVYNAVILMKIINRPWWYTILLFVPIVNLIMFPVIWVETLRSFGRNSNTDTLLGVVTLGFYIYYINYSVDVTHIPDRSLQPRTVAGEWISSILFAVVAATLVHTYFMQPFTIPTSSLEKTLLVGDYLFVSKFHYGARTPMTPISPYGTRYGTFGEQQIIQSAAKIAISTYAWLPKDRAQRHRGVQLAGRYCKHC